MNELEKQNFAELKMELSRKLRESHPTLPEDISQWKAKGIALLQEDLLKNVNGRISEKWFYTHIKSVHDTLPRIDILDLLSQYLDYEDWASFRSDHSSDTKKKNGVWRYLLISGFGLVLLSLLVYFSLIEKEVNRTFQFCFLDQYTGQAVIDQPISVVLLDEEQSPVMMKVGGDGCIKAKTKQSVLKLVVRSPYYSLDTLVRNLTDNNLSESVVLKPNDHAFIIHLFSSGKVSEWKDRRKDLENMFHANARIYQIFEHSNSALAIYNKEEFISKLILPTGTLKNLEILDVVYEEDKIAVLRFKKTENEK